MINNLKKTKAINLKPLEKKNFAKRFGANGKCQRVDQYIIKDIVDQRYLIIDGHIFLEYVGVRIWVCNI